MTETPIDEKEFDGIGAREGSNGMTRELTLKLKDYTQVPVAI